MTLRRLIAASVLALAAVAFPAAAQEYYDVDVDLPAYPEMEPLPDSPVYWAPTVPANYFFYDGLYWDFFNDGWYSSPWYNGPWTYVDPVYVPTYVLWVPVRYYHKPPAYFHGWHADRPPRWGQHWGPRWQEAHNRIYTGARPQRVERAPLPHYQAQFNRANYPRSPQQQAQVHSQNYAYRPREQYVRQQYQSHGNWAGGQPQQQHTQGGPSQGHRGGEDRRGR
jgi:hypothetical protein